MLGTIAVGLVAWAGARLFAARCAGLLAGLVLAVAFLPVNYSHFALNDVPTLVGVSLSLVGTAGILRRGRARDFALAGVGLGLGCATKYTAGIVLAPLVAAVGWRPVVAAPASRARARRGAGVAAFLFANPYALLDPEAFHRGSASSPRPPPRRASSACPAPRLRLLPVDADLGPRLVPLAVALGGAVWLALRDRRAGARPRPRADPVPAVPRRPGPLLARWLLPITPS